MKKQSWVLPQYKSDECLFDLDLNSQSSMCFFTCTNRTVSIDYIVRNMLQNLTITFPDLHFAVI